MQTALQEDGLSSALYFDVPDRTHIFALRTYPTTTRAALDCFALREVLVNDSDTWVGPDSAADSGDYCTTCEQRVSIGQGYGLFMLPSAQDAPTEIHSLSARVGLRDCATLTPLARSADSPAELWVELATWAEPPATRSLQLPVNIVLATRYGLTGGASILPDALATVQHIWAAANIQIQLTPSITIEAPPAPLVYSATDIEALRALSRAVHEALPDASGPTLLLTPCLQRADAISGGQSEPWAVTPHAPGGSAPNDEPDQIFIAAERCEGLTPAPLFTEPAMLGTIMAHELGHYLGLYHVAEHDGRQDMLADTSAMEPNLMQATPSPTAHMLSASQIAVARRHSAFADSP